MMEFAGNWVELKINVPIDVTQTQMKNAAWSLLFVFRGKHTTWNNHKNWASKKVPCQGEIQAEIQKNETPVVEKRASTREEGQ